MRRLTSILVFMFALALSGQGQTIVSGRVSDARGPIEHATVSEIDANHRVVNSTSTDKSGLFTMGLKNPKDAIRVIAKGYLSRIIRINKNNRFNIHLLRSTTSLEEQLLLERHPIVESYKLLYGRVSSRQVPQQVVVELLNDSLLTLSFPIYAHNSNESYPVERKMMFVDYVDGPLLTGRSIVEALPEPGEPEMRDRMYNRDEDVVYYYFGDDYTPGSYSESTPYYNYPKFLFNVNDILDLMDNQRTICRVLIDTSRGDNYWQLFLQSNCGYELKKIITKLSKKLK